MERKRIRSRCVLCRSYLLHFTKGLVPVPRQMPQLAHDLVRRGLYGIPSTAMLRHRIRPGDLVVVTVGSPHRVFVADAVVESGYHRFHETERARRPEWMDLDHGIGLRDVHTSSTPVPIMSVWPATAAGATTNKTALFYGTLIMLKPGDEAAILAAADDAARDCRARYPTRDALAGDAGQAAVAIESGKRKAACFRWACNKRLRYAFTTLADTTRHWHRGRPTTTPPREPAAATTSARSQPRARLVPCRLELLARQCALRPRQTPRPPTALDGHDPRVVVVEFPARPRCHPADARRHRH